MSARAIVDQWAAVGMNRLAKKSLCSNLSQRGRVVQVADNFSTQYPEIVYVPAHGLRRKTGCGQMLDEWPEANHQFFTWRQVSFQSYPRALPVVQIAAVGGSIRGRRRSSNAVYSGSLRSENRLCHGTDHHSKPLSSPSGIRRPRNTSPISKLVGLTPRASVPTALASIRSSGPARRRASKT